MALSSSLRVFETHARTYRHTYRGSVISTFLNPVLYLAAMGMGLGTLVDGGTGTEPIPGVPYLAYLAPGLLAAAAMQTGTGDASYPVMAGMKWTKTYHAALATPVGVFDLVAGHLGWVLVRVMMTAVAFAAAMVLFDAATGPRALLACVPAALVGIAFGSAVTGYTSSLENEFGLSSLFRFGIVPMFLFSGTFFPITQLPGWIQPLAYLTPLWHGVELTRAAALGTAPAWSAWVHVAYLLLWFAAGAALALYNFRRRLEK